MELNTPPLYYSVYHCTRLSHHIVTPLKTTSPWSMRIAMHETQNTLRSGSTSAPFAAAWAADFSTHGRSRYFRLLILFMNSLQRLWTVDTDSESTANQHLQPPRHATGRHVHQGRLRHIYDGANAPWKNSGEGFCRNLGGVRKLFMHFPPKFTLHWG